MVGPVGRRRDAFRGRFTCEPDGSQDFIELRQGAARWGCGSDIGGLPFLDGNEGDGNSGVAWWDAGFGSTAKIETDSGSLLAVLPAGKTLIDGDFRCTMGKEVVTCEHRDRPWLRAE